MLQLSPMRPGYGRWGRERGKAVHFSWAVQGAGGCCQQIDIVTIKMQVTIDNRQGSSRWRSATSFLPLNAESGTVSAACLFLLYRNKR